MTSTVRGPYFDELHIGQVFDTAPAVTLTEGLAAAHHAIVGNRLRLALDHDLSRKVSGEGALVTPALVWDLSIGQSTAATQKVRANLFYRNLRFQRFPHIGDTLHTVTTVDALRANRPQPDRPRTGMAALHIVTTDQSGRTVLDYWRCAMLPVSPGFEGSLAEDDLDAIGTFGSEPAPESTIAGWDLNQFRKNVAGLGFGDLRVGQTWSIDGPDVVTSAPELARLTGNVAAVHHDAARAGGRRLVYGGHTVGLALHHVTRAIPTLVTVLSWQSCDHLAPVHEGDALTSTVEVTAMRALDPDGGIADLRVVTSAQGSGMDIAVLDWRLSVVLP
ncbi:MaoC family dehydratase [Terrabacter terrigena]|uniref:MaoC family dehydratase n=1 Tax=Terrabacter terrigena TaxID=574718 RepID=A0ABW3N588_9MICO